VKVGSRRGLEKERPIWRKTQDFSYNADIFAGHRKCFRTHQRDLGGMCDGRHPSTRHRFSNTVSQHIYIHVAFRLPRLNVLPIVIVIYLVPAYVPKFFHWRCFPFFLAHRPHEKFVVVADDFPQSVLAETYLFTGINVRGECLRIYECTSYYVPARCLLPQWGLSL